MSTIFFLKHIFEQKFIALHMNESCLCALLYFLGVLRYLNKACVFFCVQNILIKKKIINCPDNLNYYTTTNTSIFIKISFIYKDLWTEYALSFNFFRIFVTNEIFKILFAKSKLISCYYFINIYIDSRNLAFIFMKFVFFNFTVIKFYNLFYPFLYLVLIFFITFLIIITNRFWSFCNIFFYTQKAFVFHFLRDFCNVHDNIVAFFLFFA